MDEHGLPIVGKGIDYTRVNALDPKRTLHILNKFIIHSVTFLNKFASTAEEKLHNLSLRIHQLEITLDILDAQLQSIGGLEDVQATAVYTPPVELAAAGTMTAATSSSAAQPVRDPVESSTNNPPSPPAEGPPPLPGAMATEEEGPPPPPAAENEALKVKDHPLYKDYFRKLRIGANPLQLQIEMKAKGLDPAYLENPDAPAPSSGGGAPAAPLPSLLPFDTQGDTSDSDSDSDSLGSSDSEDDFVQAKSEIRKSSSSDFSTSDSD